MTLIHRLEQATEGSRELDAEIAEYVGIKVRSRRDASGHSKGREWLYDTDNGGIEMWSNVPLAFSTSLDAALTMARNDEEWLGMMRAIVNAARNGSDRKKYILAGVAENIRARTSDR